MSLYKWSKTAATNATADGSINWAEGQAPSSVNDSARGMMAAAAKYRDDLTGAQATAGTSTAYTLITNQVFDTLAHMDGAMLGFRVHLTCGATVTLNVDGLGAKPLRAYPGIELSAGDMQLSSFYVVTYSNADAVFYLHNPQQSFPTGTLMLFQQTAAPTGWTKQVTHNDKALRVVAAAAGSGGTSLFSTVFNLTATDSYTLLTADIPSHTHTDSGHTHGQGVNASGLGLAAGGAVSGSNSAVATATASDNSGTASLSSTGGGGGHSHGIDMRVQYVDLIIASKV